MHCTALQHTAAHCNALRRTAVHFNDLWYTFACHATHCNNTTHQVKLKKTREFPTQSLYYFSKSDDNCIHQHIEAHWSIPPHTLAVMRIWETPEIDVEQETERLGVYIFERSQWINHCNTLLRTATKYNTLQHTATHCNTMQHNGPQRHPSAPFYQRDTPRLLCDIFCNTLLHTATRCTTL